MAHTLHVRLRSLAPLCCTLALAGVFGCAEPAPVAPPPPPPPRALSITAQENQSKARQDRDRADCQSMASQQATSSETWAMIFTSCMSGRGYLVQ